MMRTSFYLRVRNQNRDFDPKSQDHCADRRPFGATANAEKSDSER